MQLIHYLIFYKQKTLYNSLSYIGLVKSGRQDLNLRPLRPERNNRIYKSFNNKQLQAVNLGKINTYVYLM